MQATLDAPAPTGTWPPAPRPWPGQGDRARMDVARRRLAVAMDWPASLVDEVLGCIQLDNHALRFTLLTFAHQQAVCGMNSAAWKAVQDYAIASGGTGIARVFLPDAAGAALDTRLAAQGLNEIDSLELVICPALAQLDFGALHHQPGQVTLIIDNTADPQRDIHVVVPQGCRVWPTVASHHLTVQLR